MSTDQAPSASPECPRCHELGRLVPGAYYSDPGAAIFRRLEEAVVRAELREHALRELGAELERLLPSPMEPAIDAAFAVTMSRIGLEPSFGDKAAGKRVMLRMLVTIANTLSQPAVRESGVMRLPQTIPGLFDLVPKKRTSREQDSEAPGEATPASDTED